MGISGFLIVGSVLLTGCFRATGVAAGDVLAVDTRTSVEQAAGLIGAPGARPAVTLDATEPCKSGPGRRHIVTRLPLGRGADLDGTLDRSTDVLIGVITSRGYRLNSPPNGRNLRLRSFLMTRADPRAEIEVRLHGGRQPFLELDGRVPCAEAAG